MKEFYRRHLPHWQPQSAVFFVTFRLKHSLPYEVIESLQDESYDRVIRDHEEYVRMIHYVLENPGRAGLVACWEDWPWTYCRPGIFE